MSELLSGICVFRHFTVKWVKYIAIWEFFLKKIGKNPNYQKWFEVIS